MSHKKELQFSLFNMKNSKVFGGALLKKSNPKIKRPISTKQAMHIVIRSTQAKGNKSFLTHKNKKAIDLILKKQARAKGIHLYRYENVGNHIHILLKTGHRKSLLDFLRAITGLIARRVLGVERGCHKNVKSEKVATNKLNSSKIQKFWDARPFSRIVTWGKAYTHIHKYFDKNQLQALGFDFKINKSHYTYFELNTS